MKRFYAVFLLFVLIVSNANVVSAKHYCKGHLAKENLMMLHSLSDFGCGMEEQQILDDNCNKNFLKSQHISQTPCCKNEITFLQSDKIVNQEWLKITDLKVFQGISFCQVLSNNIVGTIQNIETIKTFYDRYRWNQNRNIQSLYQIYII